MTAEFGAALAIAGTLCGIFFGYAIFKRNLKNDGAQSGSLLSDVGYIKAGIDDLKKEQKDQKEEQIRLMIKVENHEGRICNVENALKVKE